MTVVLPVYNSSRYIREALNSILAQTYADICILVGDDGSKDDTVSIIKSYTDPRICLLQNSRNLGIFANLNKLFAEATSEFVKICCADDVLDPVCIERQIAFMKENPSLAFATCYEAGESAWGNRPPPLGMQQQLPAIVSPMVATLAFFAFGNIPGNLSKLIVRMSSWRQNGGFRENLPYAGDFEFWSRVAESAPFGIQRQELVSIRYHPGQASVTLNRRNELSPQISLVVESLYVRAAEQFSRKSVLKLHATMVYGLQQCHWYFKSLRHTRLQGSLRLNRNFLLPLPVVLCMYLVTANGRFGRGWTTARLLRLINERSF